jgi:glutamyl-tRNA synthetase
MSQLRVRFAPSPTGYLHIGGARTALFNFLLARQEQGTFLLRIEDTDVARSTQASVDAILQAMDWLGLSYDEGPIYQSDRFDLYRAKVQELVAAGKAYRCYCTPEELEERREAAMKSGGKPKYDRTCLHRQDQPDDRPWRRIGAIDNLVCPGIAPGRPRHDSRIDVNVCKLAHVSWTQMRPP